jgi:ribosomal protein S18 acetylase RimI-like enzyme
LAVYGSTREEELAMTNWTEWQRMAFLQMQLNAQHSHYREHHPDAEYQVIILDDVQIGRLYIARKQNEIRILDVTLLPEFRNRGTGTSMLNDLIAEAEETQKTLTIYVESFNRSLGLFKRLGFSKIGEHGYSHLMEWRPDGLKAKGDN